MEPIRNLMIEHRLIERMVTLMKQAHQRAKVEKAVDTRFIAAAVDFMQIYADRCHHGKEEDILFRELTKKSLRPEHLEMLEQLIKEHATARNITARLAKANERYGTGKLEALAEIASLLNELAELYPRHIEMEDDDLFIPSMEYFTEEEKQRMFAEFDAFDQRMIHEAYEKQVKRWES